MCSTPRFGLSGCRTGRGRGGEVRTLLNELGVEAVKQRLASKYMDTGKMLGDLQDLVTTIEELYTRLRDVQAASQ